MARSPLRSALLGPLVHQVPFFDLGQTCYNAWNVLTKAWRVQMGALRRLVLDTLKPYEPNIIDLARRISDLPGVEAVNISIYEIDKKVENAKITIEGKNIQYPQVEELIQEMGGAIHSIDEAVAGQTIIDDASTLQD
jgi:hypothetical protein